MFGIDLVDWGIGYRLWLKLWYWIRLFLECIKGRKVDGLMIKFWETLIFNGVFNSKRISLWERVGDVGDDGGVEGKSGLGRGLFFVID